MKSRDESGLRRVWDDQAENAQLVELVQQYGESIASVINRREEKRREEKRREEKRREEKRREEKRREEGQSLTEKKEEQQRSSII
jgi:hypothetical protein